MRVTVGLVLSGGGARGAYEVGVLLGIAEILGTSGATQAPFSVFAGTSVGAINASYVAAHTHLGDYAIDGLVRQWTELRMKEHLRIDLLGALGWPRTLPIQLRAKHRLDPDELGPRFGRSFIDPRPLERVVRDGMPWFLLHENVRAGRTRAIVIAALHIQSGQTHLFVEAAPGVEFREGRDFRRVSRHEPIGPDHVLASAAIPLLFPSRRVKHSYYCDGGLRFNTPIAPAIRAGAERLVVVSLRLAPNQELRTSLEAYPSPYFLLGKLLAALLLDPVDYDLQVLSRFNRLLAVLEETLTTDELQRFHAVVDAERGIAYRKLETLVFRPSQDIGRMAGAYVKDRKDRERANWLSEWMLSRASSVGETFEADLMSFLLFDGGFAERLIDLGRRDAIGRRDAVKSFFGA